MNRLQSPANWVAEFCNTRGIRTAEDVRRELVRRQGADDIELIALALSLAAHLGLRYEGVRTRDGVLSLELENGFGGEPVEVLPSRSPTGRSRFSPYATDTGRTSSRQPGISNPPRELPEYTSAFSAPLVVDYETDLLPVQKRMLREVRRSEPRGMSLNRLALVIMASALQHSKELEGFDTTSLTLPLPDLSTEPDYAAAELRVAQQLREAKNLRRVSDFGLPGGIPPILAAPDLDPPTKTFFPPNTVAGGYRQHKAQSKRNQRRRSGR